MVAPQAAPGPGQAQVDAMREKIRVQARAALTAGIISCVFAGIIFGPGALIRAAIVRSNVAKYNTGHEHLATAKTATILGIVGLSIWTVLLIVYTRV
jgi:hypothetical protein